MDSVVEFTAYDYKRTGSIAFVNRVSKMFNLVAALESITAPGCARVFIGTVF